MEERQNALGILPEKQLLKQFAIPSIIAMLVSSLYNIVDQFFIGNTVGELGNAATNIAFPLNTSCVAIALLFGIGGASTFNLAMGRGDKDSAGRYIGNAAVSMFICGLVLAVVSLLFLEPMLLFFGSPDNVLPYACEYAGITAFGFPFLILSTGGGHLVRADGSPKMTMIINLTGAIINTVLDAIFVFVLGWGMRGAAIATVIGQVIACGIVVWYLGRYQTVKLTKECFFLSGEAVGKVISLGAAPCFNQLAMMVVQVVMNKSLKYYGSLSVYGESIPIACSGIIAKVTMVVMAFIIGISQGLQPIVSYNYGAKNYQRVKRAYTLALKYGAVICVVSFVVFQLFPRQIISIFGNGSDLYYQFSEKYIRIFLFFIFGCFMQPISANFFTAIGKPKKGIFMSLTRQIIFLLPLLLIFPMFMGIDGIMYAGPVADFLAAAVCTLLVVHELKRPEYHDEKL
jgi:Na+-driven multidrug efflux pump